MATEEHIVKIAVDDEASRAFDAAARSADSYDEATKKIGITQADLVGKLTKLAVGLGAIKVVLVDGVKEFAKAEATQGRFERSIRKTTGSLADLTKAEAFTRANFEKFGYSMTQQRGYLQLLADTSGSLELAMKDLSLAMDISAADSIDLSQAVEMLRKVRNGEIEEVKRLTGINKDLAESIAKIKDPTDRANAAIKELTKSYQGASEELSGNEDKLRKWATSVEEAQEAAGRLGLVLLDGTSGVIHGLATFFGIIKDNENILDKFVLGMERASNGMQYVQFDADSGSAIEQAAINADMMDLLKQRGMNAKGLDQMMTFLSNNYTKGADVSAQTINEFINDPESDVGRMFRAIQQSTRKFDNSVNVQDVPEPPKQGPGEQPPLTPPKDKSGGRRAGERSQGVREVTDGFEGEFAYYEKVVGDEQAEAARKASMQEEQERITALLEEYDLRDQIAQLKLDGKDLDAELLAIQHSQLTGTEKELAVQKAIEASRNKAASDAKKQRDAYIEGVGAMGQAFGVAGEIAGEEEAARRATAAVDAVVYQYKAIAAGFENPAQAISYQVAAIKAAAVAAGAIGGGSGGSGGGSSSAASGAPDVNASTRENARIFAEELANQQKTQPVQITNNLSFRSVGKPGVDEMRVLSDALDEESRRRVGTR